MWRSHLFVFSIVSGFSALTGVLSKKAPPLSCLNFASSLIGLAYLSYLCSMLAYKRIIRKFSILFVCATHLKRLLTGCLFLTLSCLYHYLLFVRYVCDDGEKRLCGNLYKAYKITLILNVATNAIQAFTVGIFAFTFVFKRLPLWKEILHLEEALLFNEEIKSQCSVICRVNDYYNAKSFIDHWTSLSKDEILESLQYKAESVYAVFEKGCSAKRPITLQHFAKYAAKEGIVDCDRLWKLFSDGTAITVNRIYDALYDLSFDRQKFAFMIRTDFKMIQWTLIYSAVAVYGACFVLIMRVLNYDDAFGTGVDLFKIYILIMSYLAATIKNRISFVSLMLSQRPFNIGDLLQVNGDSYSVFDFDPAFTHLVGPTSMLIDNSKLFESPIVNLTRANVCDCVVFSMPPNVDASFSGRMQKALENHAIENARTIDRDNVRCGWVRSEKDYWKVFQCNWKYRCSISDRTSYVKMRTRVLDYIMSCASDEMTARALEFQAASSGTLLPRAKFE